MTFKLKSALILFTLFALLSGCTGEQPPFTQQEFSRFLSDAIAIKRITADMEEAAVSTYGQKAVKEMNRLIEKEVARSGWNVDRYNYIYNRCVQYGAYEHARKTAEQFNEAIEMGGSHGQEVPEEMGQLTSGLSNRTKLLKMAVEEEIPVSEQVCIHERLKDVMRIVRIRDIMAQL